MLLTNHSRRRTMESLFFEEASQLKCWTTSRRRTAVPLFFEEASPLSRLPLGGAQQFQVVFE
jgi:hypothetical protein